MSAPERLAVLVTGATGPAGRAVASRFAADGHLVALNGSDAGRLAATIRELDLVPDASLAVAGDLTDPAATRSVIDSVVGAFGRVDVVAHLVGGYAGGIEVADLDHDEVRRMLDQHLWSTLNVLQAVVPGMKARRAGRIVNTSSIFAMGGVHFASQYAAAKSAISGLTHSWARELAPWGIAVNAVAPGFVETPMTAEGLRREGLETRLESVPLGRLVTPQDISNAVAFLASDAEAAMVTGQILSPNGGERIVGI